MLPALVIHAVPLMMLVSVESAFINTLVAYVPCYLAALSLRKTSSWQMVFGLFFAQAFVGFITLQLLSPDFIIDQFTQFKGILNQFQDYKQIIENSTDGLSSYVLAQLFFGIQILSVIISSVISLMFARSLQASLFMPGGFSNEILDFRSGRLSFLILLGVSIASYYDISFAINLLPIVLAYFLLSGFTLAYFILGRKRQVRVGLILFLIILLKPSFILFAYIVFGSLDSLFNFRLYLPARVREST